MQWLPICAKIVCKFHNHDWSLRHVSDIKICYKKSREDSRILSWSGKLHLNCKFNDNCPVKL